LYNKNTGRRNLIPPQRNHSTTSISLNGIKLIFKSFPESFRWKERRERA
jgi:hypothetical protein